MHPSGCSKGMFRRVFHGRESMLRSQPYKWCHLLGYYTWKVVILTTFSFAVVCPCVFGQLLKVVTQHFLTTFSFAVVCPCVFGQLLKVVTQHFLTTFSFGVVWPCVFGQLLKVGTQHFLTAFSLAVVSPHVFAWLLHYANLACTNIWNSPTRCFCDENLSVWWGGVQTKKDGEEGHGELHLACD